MQEEKKLFDKLMESDNERIKNFTFSQLLSLKSMNFDFDYLLENLDDRRFESLINVVDFFHFYTNDEIRPSFHKLREECVVELFSQGSQSFVINFRTRKPENISYAVEPDNIILKFSENAGKEKKILEQIENANEGSNLSVITIDHSLDDLIDIFSKKTDTSIRDDFIQLSFFPRGTLADDIDEDLSSEGIIHAGTYIINGLYQMRKAGVWYHRDLRPENILSFGATLTISDFGIATYDKDDPIKDNRRFGGPNDMVSLAQILYFMSVKKHLFDKTESRYSDLVDVADEIKKERDKVYFDSSWKLLDRYTNKVDDDIKDSNLSDIINSCLTNDNDYSKIFELFKDKVCYLSDNATEVCSESYIKKYPQFSTKKMFKGLYDDVFGNEG